MIGWTINIVATLLVLIIGSYTDFKTHEVPDWVSHGFIYFGFFLNIILFIIYKDWHYLLWSAIGFGFCFLIGLAMYKMGQWGGGDSKVIMGIGSTMGLNPQNILLVTFILNTILVGAVYGIIWSIGIAIKNRKQFITEYRNYTATKLMIRIRIALYLLVALGIITAFLIVPQFKLEFFGFTALVFLLVHLWIFIKVIEKACMIQDVSIAKLTEGDWIVEDVMHKGKKITGPSDLGISKEQIALLKQYKIKTVKVKYGIPFVPSFLIAFIFAIWIGPWYLKFLALM